MAFLPGIAAPACFRPRPSLASVVAEELLGRPQAPFFPETTPPDQLEAEGGFFGRVLRLVQERQAQPARFEALLVRFVRHLETMPAAKRGRWNSFLPSTLSFIMTESASSSPRC
jgi:hypothetical protein